MDDVEDIPHATSSSASSAAAAVAAGSASREKADAYLDRQSALIDLQVEQLHLQNENLQKLDEYETSHLRWRRFNDQMKGALQIMLVLVGAAIVIGIGTAMWNASQADGLVVDAFSVPPSFAARGLGGDVVAQDFTNKLAIIHDTTNGFSASSNVSRDHGNVLSVDIPDTGVSVATVWRLLRAWLGHEQHLNGSLRDAGGGKLVLATTLGNGTAISVSGTDLNALEQKEAEKVYCAADGTGCLNYLLGHGRWAEVYALAQSQLASARTPEDLALGYSMAGVLRAVVKGDYVDGLALVRIGIGYAPQLANVQMQAMALDQHLGHLEDLVAVARKIAAEKDSDQTKPMQGGGFAQARSFVAQEASFWMRDFDAQKKFICFGECTSATDFASLAYIAILQHDGAQYRALIARASLLTGAEPVGIADSETVARLHENDWAAAMAAAQRGIKANQGDTDLWRRLFWQEDQDGLTVELAEAQAHLGDVVAARATLAPLHGDCYICVDGHANVEAIAKNWAAADRWFRRATAEGPSIPIAYSDWGAMLMERGDLDGAIAKFTLANQKGPHFADPLEMWGEALIAKNRSDLALAKFEEANKYAPNWGRLHLKWGEALFWSGDKVGAQKQFTTAAHLDLAPGDRSELVNLRIHEW